MAQIIIEIPDNKLNSILDAFKSSYPLEGRNKGQNAKYQIRKFIVGVYASYKTKQVHQQNLANLDSADTQSDIDMKDITII